MHRLQRDQVDVGWICALHLESAASRASFDEGLDIDFDPNDGNIYTAGRIGGHNIVMACLPEGDYGIGPAAIVAERMKLSFPSVTFRLLVGIGGGIPTEDQDIRLGDVVVSRPMYGHGGVVNYDLYRVEPNGSIQPKGFMNSPPSSMLGHLSALRTIHEMEGRHHLEAQMDFMFKRYPGMIKAYQRPDPESNALESEGVIRERPPRLNDDGRPDHLPHVHYGLIASGNKVIASAKDRDMWLARVRGILCFEMEAGGIMNTFRCVVIRGVCDYADASKSDIWQRYAAIAAAAYARELLLFIPASTTMTVNPTNNNVSSGGTTARSPMTGITPHLRTRRHEYWYFLTLKAIDEYQVIYNGIPREETGGFVLRSKIDETIGLTQNQVEAAAGLWDRFHRCKVQNGRCTTAVSRVPRNIALAYMYMIHIELLQPEIAASVKPLRVYSSGYGCQRAVFSQGRLETLFAFGDLKPCFCKSPPCGRQWNFAAAEWGTWCGGPARPLCALAEWSQVSDAELKLADGPGAQLCEVVRKAWKGRSDAH